MHAEARGPLTMERYIPPGPWLLARPLLEPHLILVVGPPDASNGVVATWREYDARPILLPQRLKRRLPPGDHVLGTHRPVRL